MERDATEWRLSDAGVCEPTFLGFILFPNLSNIKAVN